MTRRILVLGAALLAATAAACGNPNYGLTILPIMTQTLTVYALTGTPASYPSALNIVSQSPVRVDGAGNFDVGFDLDRSGRVVVYPARLLVSAVVGARTVGVQTVATPFDSLSSAPSGGYRTDSTTIVVPHQTFVIESTRAQAGDPCQYSFASNLYAKAVVDSVNLGSRIIYLRSTVNPNCGVRTLKR